MSGKLTYEAKRAVERVGVNPLDLMEKTIEEFNYKAKGDILTPEIMQIRFYHFENRRRKKLRIVADYIKNNR